MIIRPGLLAILVLLTAAAALAQPGGNPSGSADKAKPGAANPPGTHTLNLKDADIQVLIATVSEITGKNFIIGPNVQGKVTVVSATPMKPDEIYDTFLSVLRVNGYAAIQSGSMVKIVAEATAQQDGSGGLDGVRTHETDELVTQIVPLKHVSATELVPILRPLMPQGAQLIAHPGSNSLVISDRAGNVQRLISIIGRIDTASDNGVEMITLQHASAAELARTLTQLNEGKASDLSADASKVFADERTNSILLSGGKSGRLRLRALITHLDTPISSGGDTNVVYLHYAAAKDLVPILRGVASTLTNEAPVTAKAGGGESAGPANSGSIATIQAHEDNNALIISAPPAVFRSLLNVIRQLDVRRSQVLIEAVIAEVSDETANELGVQWQLPLGDGNHVIGGTNFSSGNSSAAGNNILSAAVNPLGVGNGFNLGYIEGTVSVGNVKLFQLGALVTALRSDGKSNILSTPQVMTLDNQQAVIKVGQEVPFLTGSYQTTASSSVTVGSGGTTAGGISNPFQTIQRKDVGLTLTVTPHINEGDSVKLEIHQIVSSLAPPVSGASDLVTNNREVQTTVLIKDGSVFVIGGLISDTIKDNNQQVPGLGSIPLLGNLFRYRSNDHVKQNLMVFLHPRILRDAVSEASVASEKYNFIRTEQIQMRENSQVLTPEHDMPLLPDVHDFLSSPTLDPAPYTTPPPKEKH
ncbi:MAG TPA: type II secretion system secretin GspD [Rhodanobacteraceae bacterium]|nr:type II secretion system secretin GspD [Rhodanobacteraceae bacterium]